MEVHKREIPHLMVPISLEKRKGHLLKVESGCKGLGSSFEEQSFFLGIDRRTQFGSPRLGF